MNFDDWFIVKGLPEPLSQQELLEYFQKYKKGDLSAKDVIITHNMRLVMQIVRKYFINYPHDKNELVSVGLLGLIECIDSYDITKKYKFSTFATKCIYNKISNFLRDERNYTNVDIFNKILNPNISEQEITFELISKDENFDTIYEYENKELITTLKNLIDKLSERDKEIITLRFGLNGSKPLTYKEIAKKFGFSIHNTELIVNRILKYLGLQLQKQELIEKVKEIPGRKLQTIYKYLNNYSKETIDELIETLSEEEKNLILLRYGSDLEHPITNPKWNKLHQHEFYNILMPKIKKLLINKAYKPRPQNNNPIPEETLQNDILPKEDYEKIIELLHTVNLQQLTENLSPKENVIISLKFGYVDRKRFTINEISNFLKIPKNEVIETIRKFLLICRKTFNESSEYKIQFTTTQPNILKKQK